MKTVQQLSSSPMGRLLLHVVCAVLRPTHLNWHWQGIRRELRPPVQRLALAALAALPAAALAQGNYLSAPDGNPTNALIVANGGNVGIDTTSPAERLHVVGNLLVEHTGYPSETGRMTEQTFSLMALAMLASEPPRPNPNWMWPVKSPAPSSN